FGSAHGALLHGTVEEGARSERADRGALPGEHRPACDGPDRLRPDGRVMASAVPRPSRTRRWIRRIPRRLRMHWKLPTALPAFAAVAVLVFGGVRVSPMITGTPTVVATGVTRNIDGAADLFDASRQHTVSVRIPDAEYRRMVDAYVDDGEK